MIRSMLSIPATFTDYATNQSYHLNGFGESVEVQVSGTHDTEHAMEFHVNTTKSIDNIVCMLSYKGIDRNLFEISSALDIDQIMSELEKNSSVNWPTGLREEELRWQRQFYENEHLKPLFKYEPSRSLSCTLMLDVVPSSLFFNSTALKVKLVCGTWCCSIPANGVAVPMAIQTSFTIGIKLQDNWSFSCPIHLQSNNQQRSIKLFQPYYELPETGNTIIKIRSTRGVSKFVINTVMERGVQQFYFSTYFVVCNFSDYAINAWAFCSMRKDRRKIKVPVDLQQHIVGDRLTGRFSIPVIPKGDAK